MRKLALVATLALLAAVPAASQAQVSIGVALPGIRVHIGPPAPRYEPVPVAPSPRHQWIAGYWGWRNNAQVWVPGHWSIPPAYGYVWEPARWVQAPDGGWMYYDGHWRPVDQPEPTVVYQPPAPPMQEVIAETPPPPPYAEVRPPVPFAGAIWIPGFWRWNGHRHTWVGGRWSPRPAGHEWQEDRWEHRDDGRWVERPGHWRESPGRGPPPGRGPEHLPGERRGDDRRDDHGRDRH
jgi:hypothetical protein